MKTSEISVFSRVLLGLCLLLDLGIPTVYADFTFGDPVNLESVIPLIDAVHESIDCFSSDGLEMYIESDRSGGWGSWDLWVLKRDSIDDGWGPPENLGSAVNSPEADTSISISADGLTLLFASNRAGGYGGQDIYVATRLTRQSPWGQAVNLGSGINGSSNDSCPWMTADGLELYFDSRRSDGLGGYDLWVTMRATTASAWGQPVNLGPQVNSAYSECNPSLSPDGRILLFSGNQFAADARPGGYGGSDLWMMRRQSPDIPWQVPVNLGPTVNRSRHDIIPRMSSDGSMLYFSSNSGNTWDNWQVPILPIIDFNGDGKADGKDVVTLAEHWDESDSVCDIGPYAWGDGIVDEQDLFVLAKYMEDEDFADPTLVAHWALDESEGIVAHDSAGDNDGVVMGICAWQPAGGQVNGALAFDGMTSIQSDRVLNPSDGPFSVLAWIKGAVPGQVLVSQTGGANWLMTDASAGTLATDLIPPSGRTTVPPLVSDTVITDNSWHRIGLVWNGTSRALYVDHVLVAEDAQDTLAGCSGDMNIGCDKDMTPGMFWEGLIDDVRIYNRTVKP